MDEELYVDSFKPHMMDVVNAWCNGAEFAQICKMTDIFEGKITDSLYFYNACTVQIFLQNVNYLITVEKFINICTYFKERKNLWLKLITLRIQKRKITYFV